MLESMTVLGKWSLLISLSLTIFGLVFLSENEEEELDFPDWVKDKIYLRIKKYFLVFSYNFLTYLNTKIDALIWIVLDELNTNYEKKEVKKWKIKKN